MDPERKRSEQRLTTQYAITRVLAESDTLAQAAPLLLQEIAKGMEWEWGALWTVDREAGVMGCCGNMWHAPNFEVADFDAISREITFTPGQGLPGRVWQSAQPAWITDVTKDSNFPRAAVAAKVGLRGAIAFPILLGGETLGVIEFFSRAVRQPDEEQLDTLSALGSQIGQFIERKRAQADIERSLSLLRATLESTADGILVIDLEGRIVVFNQKFADMWGLSPELLAERDDRRALAAVTDKLVDSEAFLARVRAVYSQPEEESFDTFELKDGRVFERYSQPQRVAGVSVGRVWSFRDVTAGKRAEMELLRLNRALRVLSVCNQAVTRSSDEVQLLEQVCHAIVGIGGYRLAWVAYAEFDEAKSVRPVARAGRATDYVDSISVTWADNELGRGPTGTAIRTGLPVVCNEILSDPRFLPWRAQATAHGLKSSVALPLMVEGRAMGALMVYAREPDAFDENEANLLQQATNDLAHGIAVLRARLERSRAAEEKQKLEAQLRQSQKMEAMGTLAGGIAHDFNNILGAILGYGEMAHKSAAPGSATRRYLDNVMIAGNRAKALVGRILAFSRSGLAERAPVHMESVTAETLQMLRASLPDDIELRTSLAAGNASVIGDTTQIHQVVMNLCSNAIQAMASGGTLSVKLDRVTFDASKVLLNGPLAPGEYLRLEVGDTGIGIEPALLERMFDPFFTTKGIGEGTGLGLSLVYGIVRDHGGGIDVHSHLGTGSTFEIYLPMAGESGAPVVSAEAETPRGRGETVMLVDDEPALVALGEEMLAELGYEPIGFQGSVAALQAFHNAPQRFDAVLTDEIMPEITGTELAREIRKLRPDIPILLMSGYGGRTLARRAATAGINDLLNKPLQSPEIAASLARALQSSGSSES